MLTIGNGLADALFSAVQQRLLGLLFGHPERSFYAKEIVKALQSGTGAVTRELQKLENSGLVSAERIGNQKHYRANVQSPIYQDLRGIVQKTVGLHAFPFSRRWRLLQTESRQLSCMGRSPRGQTPLAATSIL